MDKKDGKMLYYLTENSRMPITQLAKKTGLSVQSAKYRLDNLFERKVITKATAVINFHKLGYYTYRIYLRLQKASPKDEEMHEAGVEFPQGSPLAEYGSQGELEPKPRQIEGEVGSAQTP